MSNRARIAFALVAFHSSMWAAEPAQTLDQIKQRATRELASLPNYVCIDSVERTRRIPGERGFRTLDRIRVEQAHIDGTDRFSWIGSAAFLGKGQTPTGYGLNFKGDFADNRVLIFGNPWTTIRFSGEDRVEGRPALRFDYEVPVERGGLSAVINNVPGRIPTRGSFWADPVTAAVLRIDVEGRDIPEDLRLKSIVARTMYWQVLIGGRGVTLARNSEFVVTDSDGIVGRNQSIFSSCREYRVESTISFDSDAPAAGEPPSTAAPTRLPNGVELQLTLDTLVDSSKAAVGDVVLALVQEASGGESLKGAKVYGRVARVIRFTDRLPAFGGKKKHPLARKPGLEWGQHLDEVLIGLEFSEVEFRRARMPFTGRLVAVEPTAGAGKRSNPVRSFGYYEDAAFVRYDPPGSASLYISDEDPVLRKGLVLRWITSR